MKFLIDECLSPGLVKLARDRGYHESTHVTWLGMQSRKDWAIVRRSIAEGFILVTNNTVDFTALYERQNLHAGLICLNAALGRMRLEVQKALFLLALDMLADQDSSVLPGHDASRPIPGCRGLRRRRTPALIW